jgi:DNA-binding NtrC family response regulator
VTTQRVLFVDDDDLILKTFKALLRRKFDLVVALGPVEGLRAIDEEGPFAVVVADMNMPVMDGMQFLAKVKAKLPETVCMILSGTVSLSASLTVVQRGLVFRVLEKPCPTQLLRQMLEEALALYEVSTSGSPVVELASALAPSASIL